MSAKPSVVIDTQVFLRAAINRDSLPAKLVFDLRSAYQLVISEEIRNEVYEVLHRPEIRARHTTISETAVDQVLALYVAAIWVTPEEVPVVSRDPKDDMFLACAVVGRADYIVSEDKDLLVLNPYEGIQILNVPDFLRLLQDRAAGQE